jgi:thiol-disulfide isomerase/thioredoxin
MTALRQNMQILNDRNDLEDKKMTNEFCNDQGRVFMLKIVLAFGIVLLLLPQPVSSIVLSGTVCEADGRPLSATTTLVRLSYQDPLGSPLSVCQDSAQFKLTVSDPGLYLFSLEAEGYERLEIPMLLDAGGKKKLRIFPRRIGDRESLVPICADAQLEKWAAIHRDQRERHARYELEKRVHEEEMQKGSTSVQWPIDWKNDLETFLRALGAEKDPLTKSFLAACYMDLGSMGADLDSRVMPIMLSLLPGKSPFWNINPRNCIDVYNNAEPPAAHLFIRDMAERNPDPETRAFAMLIQINEAASEYDVDAWRKLFRHLVDRYPGSRAAKSARKNYDPVTALANGQVFPAFQLTDLAGHVITPDTFKGKVLLVDFWATWCPPCVKEIPKMHALYERYKKEGLEILSLAIDEKNEKIAEFRKQWPMPWFHAILAGGRNHPLPYALMVSTIPRAFLVGRDGKIIECKRARLRGESLEAVIGKVMRKNSKPGNKGIESRAEPSAIK